MKSFFVGKLIVKPTRAKLTRDTEFLGKMDPYIALSVGDEKRRTKTHDNAGKTPVWFDVFEFNKTNEETIFFDVHDEDVGKDDLVGSGTISLDAICVAKPPHFSEPIKIFYKEKEAGEVYFEITFVPETKPGKGPKAVKMKPYAPGEEAKK